MNEEVTSSIKDTLDKIVKMLEESIKVENTLGHNQQVIIQKIKRQNEKIKELEAKVKEYEGYLAGYNACGYND